jgi:tetratricopeptide (TPR) repeat protein
MSAEAIAHGDAALAAGDLATAAQSYQQVLRADPSSVPALAGMARLALLAERPAEARFVLARLLGLAPRHAEALALDGVERLTAGDASGALDRSLEARAADTRCGLGWAVAGKAHLALGELAPAAAAARRALELQPRDFESRLTLAHVAVEEGRGHDAIDELVGALEVNPRCLYAYLALGGLYEQLDQSEVAARLYREGSRHLPEIAVLRERLASLPAA